MSQGSFILDLDRCTGCSACAIACRNENPVSEGVAWRTVHTYNRRRSPDQPVFHYSLACNHCLDPACLEGCPARAYRKNPETGAVVLEPAHCIGCEFCSWVCPYDAPRRGVTTGAMEKCTFCNHRLVDGLEPACVLSCPTDALGFAADASYAPFSRPGFPETGLRPSVSFRESRRAAAPSTTFSNDVDIPDPASVELSWSAFRSEWALWFFSSVATMLVAWFVAEVIRDAFPIPGLFAAAGVIAMAVSTLHLGKPGRMLRSVLGIRSSWISREIVCFSLFFAGACGLTAYGRGSWVVWPIVVFGVAALFSMDMVYRIRSSTVCAMPHSAMTTLTVVLYLGIILELPIVVVPAVVLKTALYLVRGRPGVGHWWWVFIRLGIGLAVPVSASLSVIDLGAGLVLVAAALGELMDRAELYAGLSFLNPRRQIDRDFRLAARSSAG